MELDPDCRRCGLSRGRTHVVGPDGDLGSSVCFVGEAPGEKEDQQGRPFVGRAGKMLDRLFEEEGLPRDRIMITNTVKCRPPGNRTPKVEERRACLPYLEQELEGRRLVVALGRTACCNLLGKAVKMEEEVNRPREVTVGRERVFLLPAYHPAACLFNLNARASLRETIRIAKGFLRS
jgi:uracil-DNA glycosylase